MTNHPTETVEAGLPEEDLRLLAPGTMLARRYEIDRPLGIGGYAVVYAAYDHELAQRIAVKVLRPDRVTPASIKRLRREVAVAREVASSRLVRLYDIGQDGELSFITMELVDGTSLRRELASGPLAVDEALRVAESILEALELLHAKGLIHRDLKPANILVSDKRRIKLADFGLARHWENEGISATGTAAVVGTLEYVSPEQALGQRLDPRSDLYSFGVLLYEMLTGRLPFGSASSLGAAVAHVTTRPPDIRKSRSDLPTWLAVLLQRLLEKDPDKRPASAAAVRAALRRKSIDWGYRWRKARMSVLSAVGVILLSGLGGAWARNHHETRFDRIATDSAGITQALDRRGRVLWSRDGLRASLRAAAVKVRDGETRVIGIPGSVETGVWDAERDAARAFVVHDAQTGEVVDSINVPPAAPVFPLPPTFHLGGVNAVDTDHDGLEEIVACYMHVPWWPSYTLFIDPRTRESAVILYASGHHRFLGTIDVDGDGTDEILLGGPNNRMGWRFGLAAVRVRRGNQSTGRSFVAVNTPDAVHFEPGGNPVWYLLLPRRASYAARIDGINRETRTLDLLFDDNHRERISFDGFSVAVRSELPVSIRRARRETAYQFLRDAEVNEKRGLVNTSIANAATARQAAHDAGDPVLKAWLETVEARLLAASGRPTETVRPAIEEMLAKGNGGAELCWEVAETYSRGNDPGEAAWWYIRAIDLTNEAGHTPVDFLYGAVISLAETGDWARAAELIETFAEMHPAMADGARAVMAFVSWQAGTPMYPGVTTHPGLPKFTNYALLELEWSRGVDDPESFLQDVRRLMSLTEEAPWMRSLEAEILASSGRVDEAIEIAREAMAEVTRDPTDAYARFHRGLVEERLQRIERRAEGRADEKSQH